MDLLLKVGRTTSAVVVPSLGAGVASLTVRPDLEQELGLAVVTVHNTGSVAITSLAWLGLPPGGAFAEGVPISPAAVTGTTGGTLAAGQRGTWRVPLASYRGVALEVVPASAVVSVSAKGEPVSGPLTDAQLRATRVSVEPLGIPGVARQLAAGAASANTVLTVGVGRISIHARGADIRYTVGAAAQTASATSHFIAAGERLDIDVPATPNIAVIRSGSTDGTLELTELS